MVPLGRPHPDEPPLESWLFMRQWAEQRGWGSYKCAGAMLLAATPAERKRIPEQRVLSGYWRRWLKGENIPDAHVFDPNVRGFYRPIIARMMGTTPEAIWPARKSVHKAVETVQDRLANHRARTIGALADERKKLAEYRRHAELIPDVEGNITALEAQLGYLNAMLAVPAPDEPQAPAAARA